MYQSYKQSRDKAWKCLIDCNITALPVKLNTISKKYNVKIKDNNNINLLRDNQLGCVALINDELYIVLDRTVSIQRQRYTMAHELGHIVLEHTLRNSLLLRNTDREDVLVFTDTQEYQAERFAMNLLAPACVLWGLDIHKADDIAKICNISEQSAKKRADRMRTLYKRNMFLSSDLEKQVYQQFKKFIEENK